MLFRSEDPCCKDSPHAILAQKKVGTMQTNGQSCVRIHFIVEYKIHLAWAIACSPPTGDSTGEMCQVGQIRG